MKVKRPSTSTLDPENYTPCQGNCGYKVPKGSWMFDLCFYIQEMDKKNGD